MQESSPFLQVIVAYFLFPLFLGNDRKYEVQVRMGQFVVFQTRRTLSARIRVSPSGAIHITGIGKGQGKGSTSTWFGKQLGVRQHSRLCRLYQMPFDFLLSDNVFEIHTFCFYFSLPEQANKGTLFCGEYQACPFFPAE